MGATPDGFAVRPDHPGMGVVQCKVISRSAFRRRWLDDPGDSIAGDAQVPIYYKLQTLTEMMLADCAWGVLAVCIVSEFDMDLRLFEVERDPHLEDRIRGGVEQFWTEYFDPGVMPPFEPQRDQALVRMLYPQDDGSAVDLSTHNRAAELAQSLIETRAAIAALKKTEEATAVDLQTILGEHSYGRLADGRVLSWKAYQRRAYTVPPALIRPLRVLQQMPKGEE
jgi:hypothetical protein